MIGSAFTAPPLDGDNVFLVSIEQAFVNADESMPASALGLEEIRYSDIELL